ncbi:MAG: hypothetical protein V5A88_04170 [Candidatus Thermoplasmatota archaeon]
MYVRRFHHNTDEVQLGVEEDGHHNTKLDNVEAIAEDYLENIFDLKDRILKDEITVFWVDLSFTPSL